MKIIIEFKRKNNCQVLARIFKMHVIVRYCVISFIKFYSVGLPWLKELQLMGMDSEGQWN